MLTTTIIVMFNWWQGAYEIDYCDNWQAAVGWFEHVQFHLFTYERLYTYDGQFCHVWLVIQS